MYWGINESKLRCEIQVVEHHSRDINTNIINIFVMKLIGRKQTPEVMNHRRIELIAFSIKLVHKNLRMKADYLKVLGCFGDTVRQYHMPQRE